MLDLVDLVLKCQDLWSWSRSISLVSFDWLSTWSFKTLLVLGVELELLGQVGQFVGRGLGSCATPAEELLLDPGAGRGQIIAERLLGGLELAPWSCAPSGSFWGFLTRPADALDGGLVLLDLGLKPLDLGVLSEGLVDGGGDGRPRQAGLGCRGPRLIALEVVLDLDLLASRCRPSSAPS